MLTEDQMKSTIERLIFLPMRLRHRARAREKYQARTGTIDAVRRVLNQATEIKSEKIRRLYNIALYILLVDQDLADFTDSIIYATGNRRRVFFAKHEAVLLYEAAEDLRQMLGRDFRAAVKSVCRTDEQLNKINAACSTLHKFWEDHSQFLNSIRNILAAHREHDALKYVTALELIKPLEVMRCAVEFSQCLERLVMALTEIFRLTTEPRVILQDLIDSVNERQSLTQGNTTGNSQQP